jgi:succinate dehydrogenase / fumarate reductase cytochrome b subunit
MPPMQNQRSAPVFLNLLRIRFPVGAVTSIAHRLSGLLLFLLFPVLVYWLDLSLRDPAGYAEAREWLQCGWVRLVSVVIVWSLIHHLFAGLRFLLIDLGIGVERTAAHRSAWAVNGLALLLVLAYIGWIV